MSDPLTLAALGGVVAAEGIKFLYGQVAEVVKAWRTRRDERRKALEVPIVPTAALDAAPARTEVDAAVVDQHHAAMVELWARLAPYANGLQEVDVTDDELARTAGELRALLEAAYGQRFTFRGEHREPTGTLVTVTQAVGPVSGRVVGVRGDVGSGAAVEVRQEATEVTADGTVIGVDGRISG
ncbi:hypothetical protein [Kutzneria kofuensis]|uniref:Uncharacterized protein n=1 Tax=Kutzneria kofuensis TaxID=103725 RepID=A0A7W9KQA2_9PSEU|nr:hypothetical protein [Kutzneria kofuensis]MBB5896744.1 hypothetical protein [Kutzneria kofuensis]